MPVWFHLQIWEQLGLLSRQLQLKDIEIKI